jgi:phage protein D
MAELKRRNQTLIEGTLECIGDPELRPGMTVNIEKVGERFSGTYYVKSAKHSISESGYKTTLEVRRCL